MHLALVPENDYFCTSHDWLETLIHLDTERMARIGVPYWVQKDCIARRGVAWRMQISAPELPAAVKCIEYGK